MHTYGTFYCTRHASVHMKEQGYGRILNVVSRAGLVGASGTAAYGAGKGGIYGFTNVAARDLAVVAAYLCSKESGDVNGRFFFVQGGQVGFFDPIAVGQSLVKDGRWTPTSSPPPSPSSTSPRWRASTSGGEVAALSLFCRGVSTARARVRLQS